MYSAESTQLRDVIVRAIAAFDHRNRWWGCGRSLFAAAQVSVLLFTPIEALITTVAGIPGPRCDSVRAASLLCLGEPGSFHELRRWLLLGLFVLVASGYRPRFTALPHLWATYSLSMGISLPDGGEAIGLIVCLLITPLALADGRKWHWVAPEAPLRAELSALCAVFTVALRIQLAFIYFDATIAKFTNSAWVEGTAVYYVSRDPGFGDGGIFRQLDLAITSIPLGTMVLSWGALVVEMLVGALLLANARWRRLALTLDILLHVGIGLTIGLWSFAVIMIGSATMAANPDRRLLRGADRAGQGGATEFADDGGNKYRCREFQASWWYPNRSFAMSSSITVVAKGHPVNYWFLKLAAYPVVSINDGPAERLSWGDPGKRLAAGPGKNEIHFQLRYRGIPKPVSSSDTTVELSEGETASMLVRNGWSNQHPFTFERVDAQARS